MLSWCAFVIVRLWCHHVDRFAAVNNTPVGDRTPMARARGLFAALLWLAGGQALEADLANGLTFYVYGLPHWAATYGATEAGGHCHEVVMGGRVRQAWTTACTTHECCAGVDYSVPPSSPNPTSSLGIYQSTSNATQYFAHGDSALFASIVGSLPATNDCPSTYKHAEVELREAATRVE